MDQSWMNALIGGVIIGISVSLMLLWNGRVTGISGIINGAFLNLKTDSLWRFFFLAGLVFGGVVLNLYDPKIFSDETQSSYGITVVAGLLVGFGTILGSGCTSGHGICGISRFSPRSMIATLLFVIMGILTVTIYKYIGGLI